MSSVPTKIIAGEFGERTTRLEAKEVADLIQNADFEVYQESSAFPFVEEQERFSRRYSCIYQQTSR